ncbi:MAG TPA: hypothetical protein VGO90_13370 [Chthoniobacteraceae bacterium]|jgi:hypothetical protein|nr:hypothetical protein [Chthoniobacter sp.]HEV7868670.1 hypothetical protein [Chthoniobacteraceae bacterium]
MTFIDFAVSHGGAFRRIEINKGFEGNPNNRTLLVTQNGRSLYWVDTLRRKSGEGIFLVVDEKS